MDFRLTPEELRVLGSLIEKRYSTPDSYPLSLNALVTACNQATNRNPVVEYDAATVNAALLSTRSDGWSWILTGAGSRVPKFKERVVERLELPAPSAAILAELILRGPQTPGELRQHCARMFRFDDLETVEAALREMASRPVPLVVQLPLQPGRREARFAHLLAGAVDELDFADEPAAVPPRRSTIPELEERVAWLEEQLADVLERLGRLEG